MRVRCVCRPLDPLSAVTCPSETSAESQLPAVTVGAGGERPNRIILSYGETIFSCGYTLHPASRSPPLQIRTERNETPSVHPFSPVPNNYHTTDRQTDSERPLEQKHRRQFAIKSIVQYGSGNNDQGGTPPSTRSLTILRTPTKPIIDDEVPHR